jgi:hypothetical protein
MEIARFDIFKKTASDLRWIEASFDVNAAKIRIRELARDLEAEFIVLDQRINEIVAVAKARESDD